MRNGGTSSSVGMAIWRIPSLGMGDWVRRGADLVGHVVLRKKNQPRNTRPVVGRVALATGRDVVDTWADA